MPRLTRSSKDTPWDRSLVSLPDSFLHQLVDRLSGDSKLALRATCRRLQDAVDSPTGLALQLHGRRPSVSSLLRHNFLEHVTVLDTQAASRGALHIGCPNPKQTLTNGFPRLQKALINNTQGSLVELLAHAAPQLTDMQLSVCSSTPVVVRVLQELPQLHSLQLLLQHPSWMKACVDLGGVTQLQQLEINGKPLDEAARNGMGCITTGYWQECIVPLTALTGLTVTPWIRQEPNVGHATVSSLRQLRQLSVPYCSGKAAAGATAALLAQLAQHAQQLTSLTVGVHEFGWDVSGLSALQHLQELEIHNPFLKEMWGLQPMSAKHLAPLTALTALTSLTISTLRLPHVSDILPAAAATAPSARTVLCVSMARGFAATVAAASALEQGVATADVVQGLAAGMIEAFAVAASRGGKRSGFANGSTVSPAAAAALLVQHREAAEQCRQHTAAVDVAAATGKLTWTRASGSSAAANNILDPTSIACARQAAVAAVVPDPDVCAAAYASVQPVIVQSAAAAAAVQSIGHKGLARLPTTAEAQDAAHIIAAALLPHIATAVTGARRAVGFIAADWPDDEQPAALLQPQHQHQPQQAGVPYLANPIGAAVPALPPLPPQQAAAPPVPVPHAVAVAPAPGVPALAAVQAPVFAAAAAGQPFNFGLAAAGGWHPIPPGVLVPPPPPPVAAIPAAAAQPAAWPFMPPISVGGVALIAAAVASGALRPILPCLPSLKRLTVGTTHGRLMGGISVAALAPNLTSFEDLSEMMRLPGLSIDLLGGLSSLKHLTVNVDTLQQHARHASLTKLQRAEPLGLSSHRHSSHDSICGINSGMASSSTQARSGSSSSQTASRKRTRSDKVGAAAVAAMIAAQLQQQQPTGSSGQLAPGSTNSAAASRGGPSHNLTQGMPLASTRPSPSWASLSQLKSLRLLMLGHIHPDVMSEGGGALPQLPGITRFELCSAFAGRPDYAETYTIEEDPLLWQEQVQVQELIVDGGVLLGGFLVDQALAKLLRRKLRKLKKLIFCRCPDLTNEHIATAAKARLAPHIVVRRDCKSVSEAAIVAINEGVGQMAGVVVELVAAHSIESEGRSCACAVDE